LSTTASRAKPRRTGSPAQIRALTEYWDYLVSGVVKPACCDTALKLLGRPPRTLAEYFAEHAAELRLAA
jgi:hypothetical protein